MGLLKHGVLPFFTVFHTFMLTFYFTGNLEKLITISDWPRTQDELTAIEQHGLGAGVMGGMMILLFAGLVGILKEDSHFRGIAAVMHLLFYVNDTYDNWKIDGLDPTAAGGLALIAAVGVLVHSQEPGFFTKDKRTTTTKNA
mmetsp:Transcript_12610/g.21028  ORF Transcript_12610/g.21028 Transcript_12610/m.21028 type:complete len:142 (-) Transcript_12610:88-513(-)|eukprot:CAMPEP_0119014482 /NCGR_PEP_ID=MMETSP1176-20130426/9826_1 /TAXON_ID=265551 /ORGANISM="Synedropsis recta cf, Strain CCMP1620" /LENGTH=141 /DNA_ID=CAMNT_0006967671 /DNA_START=140 /DNA_END=565 /DNA_ORIENTATION=+